MAEMVTVTVKLPTVRLRLLRAGVWVVAQLCAAGILRFSHAEYAVHRGTAWVISGLRIK